MAKYSQASRATVAVSCPDSHLEFSVTDDGAGFEPANITQGTGLQGMTDRLAAVGGALHILSQPGHGATVSGALPVGPVTERRRSLPGLRPPRWGWPA